MTAQTRETLIYEGQRYGMATEPLRQYFCKNNSKSPFQWMDTSLWRGYKGTWEIRAGKLYIISLDGKLLDHSGASLLTLFPESVGPVLASWFSGEIRAPYGRLLRYVHAGYASTYEHDLIVGVSNGVVDSISVRQNVLPRP